MSNKPLRERTSSRNQPAPAPASSWPTVREPRGVSPTGASTRRSTTAAHQSSHSAQSRERGRGERGTAAFEAAVWVQPNLPRAATRMLRLGAAVEIQEDGRVRASNAVDMAK